MLGDYLESDWLSRLTEDASRFLVTEERQSDMIFEDIWVRLRAANMKLVARIQTRMATLENAWNVL
jgi:hypothetical protein